LVSLSRKVRVRVNRTEVTETAVTQGREKAIREDNKLRPEDRAAHDWYRFVLSYPPHLVRDYLKRFGLGSDQQVLDPFCGTGTTLVECKKRGVPSIGIEANPVLAFASRVKVDWGCDPVGLRRHARKIGEMALMELEAQGIGDLDEMPLFRKRRTNGHNLKTLSPDTLKLLLKDSISPLPLHKCLVLLETLDKCRDPDFDSHERLALARALVGEISNLAFGPEVGVGPAKTDAPVVSAWLGNVEEIADDLERLAFKAGVPAQVHKADSRCLGTVIKPNSIDGVITSPPYPNEKDYTRTTRLESILLGFIKDKHALRLLKTDLVRSNTRGVYKQDSDDRLVAGHAEIQRIANAIENRRIEMGKTSGFERLYARVTKLYFGGMLRHLADLRSSLRAGAQCAYVVGDQASYLRVMIRTGHLLADIAGALGYEVVGIDLFRTRLATATGEQLREEVVVLRWPGNRGGKSQVS